jgi:3-oxoacyl-(acyl-carrier-protein) synthase/SAM-dependent methyltransferase/aryl carrier-like protein
MDPQHRMLLEVSWHAIEDAGLTRDRLRRDWAGVFVGVCANEYGALTMRGPVEELNPYAGVGNAQSVAAGRVAYFLGVNGPAMTLDTACSSSLVAVHLAARSLRSRECRTALAGGVNLLAAPPYTMNFAKAGMLARDGRCKAFDDSADGYVRGEGCGVVVLKRLADAVADGDRIHAVVRGSAVNADGRTSGLTVPSGAAQQEVIRAALADARVEAREVQYVEAHGTGTSLGDPIEVTALDAVYGQAAGRAEALRIGSVKSNFGHLESAAGVASLIKVALAMRAGRIPQSLHFRTPNSRVEWERLGVRVVGAPEAWPKGARRAGVSSFGFSGTNAHVIVEAAPAVERREGAASGALQLTVSARTPEALRELAAAYARMIDDGNTRAVCAAARRHREVFQHRLTVAGASAAELRRGLESMTGVDGEAAIDANLLDGGADAPVELPLYPFQRERYWVGHDWDGAAERKAAADLYRMEWARRRPGVAADVAELAEAAAEEALGFDAVGAAQAVAGLEAEAARYAWEAVGRTGVVLPKYERLWRRVRAIAASDAAGGAVGESAEGRLLARCGTRLAEVLEGRQDPLALLFPSGDFSAVEAVYRESAGARLLNRALARSAAEAAARVEGKARILEVGAGTGSATASVAAAVAPFASEYWFTDVSAGFVAEAQERFAAHGFMRFGALDLDREPEAQGFAEGRFDVIIAANVVHATRDLEATVGRLRRLMAPGGVLLLQEGLQRLGWQDLTFGLTDGWWNFRDFDLRPEHPLIGRAEWLRTVGQCGFEQGAVEEFAPFGQGIVVAKATETVAQTSAVTVVLEGERGLGAEIATAGRLIVGRTRNGARLERVGADRWVLDAADPAQVREWIGAAGRVDTAVHLVGVDRNAVAQEQLCGSALHLAQALDGSGCRLLIATAGAAHAVEGDVCPGHAAATLWGFGKTAALEDPEMQVRLVDVDPYDDEAAVRALRSECANADREQLAAWRGGSRYTARLARVEEPATRRMRIVPDGCYAITGAFGGLGMLTAEWLAGKGAGELLLIGRRAPGTDAAARIEAMRHGGTRVTAAVADVTRAGELERALRERSMPLRGVVHAAGVLADGPIAQADWARFAAPFGPKVVGLWNLHAGTIGERLDFFVIYSSAVGLLGNAGQANHAAAAAAAESFAWFRRAKGLPALAIDWGAWSEVGAAAGRNLSGVRGIDPRRGLELLEAFIAADETHAVVLDVDWSAFGDRRPEHLRGLVEDEAPAADAGPEEPESGDLTARLRAEVARLLGFPAGQVDVNAGLNELGLDSLMAARLRNRLRGEWNLEVPIVELMQNPSIRELAETFDKTARVAVVEGVL